MNTIGLTELQAAVLTCIATHQRDKQLSPTLREIGAALGMGVGNVKQAIDALRARGRIDWQHRRARSIVILPSRQTYVLPGDIQAELDRYCAAHDERPADIMADAVRLFLDAGDLVPAPDDPREIVHLDGSGPAHD